MRLMCPFRKLFIPVLDPNQQIVTANDKLLVVVVTDAPFDTKIPPEAEYP